MNHSVYNIGTGRATSNAEVAQAITAVIPTASIGLDDSAPADPATFLDTSRLREDTGFRPSFDLEDGVRDYVDWLRAGHAR